MSKPTFETLSIDDESHEFFVNGVSVGSVNHDQHGWDGMFCAGELFKNVAKQLGVSVTEKEPT